MDRRSHHAQETRWRFLAVTGNDGRCFVVSLQDRTAAREFGEWLVSTGAARSVELRDRSHRDAGEGWAYGPGSTAS